MPRGIGERSDGIDVPPWWLELLNSIVHAQITAGATSLTKLGADLAEVAGRGRKWDHGSVGRFLRGETLTRQMAEAFPRVVPIPGFVFRAHSLAEALELQAVAERYVAQGQARLTLMNQRLADTDHVRDLHKRAQERQGSAAPAHATEVVSSDGLKPGRRTVRRRRTH